MRDVFRPDIQPDEESKMDGNDMKSAGKCPVMHGAITTTERTMIACLLLREGRPDWRRFDIWGCDRPFMEKIPERH